MFRLFYLIYIFTKYGSILIMAKYGLKKINKPKFVRQFFEEASGTFVKFGQILALRVDVLSREYSVELLGLLDNVKPFSYKEVERVFLEELGSTPEKIFLEFERKPFASASFGQVHAAKLEDGTIVAVKVQRPGIEAKGKVDFAIIDFLASMADLFFKIEALPWKEFASEFKSWTKHEFDYRIEADHGERFFQNNIENPNVVIPKIYHHLTTKKILVEEYLEGLHLSKVLKRLKDGTLDERKLSEMGVNLKRVAKVLVFELLRQFFLHGFYHADPHPGNIILLKNHRIGLVDFGIAGVSGSMHNMGHLIRWSKATGDIDFEEAAYHAANFAGDDLKTIIRSALPATVRQQEIDDFMRMLTDNFAQTVKEMIMSNQENLISMKKDYTAVFLEVIKAGRKFKIKLPHEFVMFFRGLSVVGLLAKQMDRNFRVVDELRRFFEVYPVDHLLQNEIENPIRRISREAAVERLTNWVAYLYEADPPTYHLAQNYLSKYAIIDK